MITPAFAVDFTTAVLDSRVTFTRTTGASNPATYVDSSGYVAAATNNQPRFDFAPVTLACKGLLIEESRANIALQSEDFSTTWTLTNATVSTNAITSPSNTLTADKLIANTTASTHFITQVITGVNNTTYTFTCYIKAGEYATAGIGFLGNGVFSTPGAQAIVINLSTGVISAGAGSPTSSITNAGNGWWRVSITATGGTNSPSTVSPYVFAINGTTYADRLLAGDNASGIYIWGAQVEAGAFATSYIPTTTTALTRNADVATITGTNFSDFWQADKGGASVLATPSTVSGIRSLVQFDDGTANEIIALRGNTTNPELYIVDGGVDQAQIDAGTIVANTSYSLTGWWQTNDCKARQNSGATVSDYTATIPTVTQARIGSDGTNYLNGTIATIDYYDSFFGRPIYTRRKNKVFPSLL